MCECVVGKQILVVVGSGEIAFYFSPKEFSPNPDEVREVGRALIYNGDSIGMCDSRLLHGEIRMYFNPMVQNDDNRETVANKILEAITTPNNLATLGN